MKISPLMQMLLLLNMEGKEKVKSIHRLLIAF